MSQHFFAAAGNQFNGAKLASSRRRHSAGDVGGDGSDIGLRIALAGGIYPPILVTCLLFVSAGYLWFDGPAFAQHAHSILLRTLATLAAGFPFMMFSCFLVSTLVAVPLVSIANLTAVRLGRLISPGWLFSIGVGLIVLLWTLLIYLAVG
jgi:hypothetical protein